ncbi:MAG: MarR family transcriptional regulator [Anaerolineales bacterium]|nr:MarR family transcriptional regulator [Anaerolineales bacterium]
MSNASISALIDKFWESVPPAWHQTRAQIRSVAAEKFNLTVEQFQVLRRIRRGINSVSALADANRTGRPAVSRAVEALVQKGLVDRTTDPRDRRHIRLSLTEEGGRILDAIFRAAEDWLATRFERLAPADRSHLLASLDLLLAAFDEP